MEPKNRTSSKVGVWLVIGIGIGVTLEAVTQNLGMWVGIAVLIALFVGGGLKPKRRL